MVLYKNRNIVEWNMIESPEINSHTMDNLFLTNEVKIYYGSKIVSSMSAAVKTGQLHAKNEMRTLLNTIHKDKPKMDYRPKCKNQNYKYLRIKHTYTLYDINHSKILYDPSPRVMEIKTKKRWNIIQLKSFCVAKKTIHKVKIQP